MDINGSRCNGPVPHEGFEREQVGAIFVMVSGKSMPEGMAGKTVFPAEFLFVRADKMRDGKMIYWLIRIPFLREEPVVRPLASRKRIPVL